jgi:hypothetical protein
MTQVDRANKPQKPGSLGSGTVIEEPGGVRNLSGARS